VTIESGSTAQLSIQLSPAAGKQEVNVTAEADAISVEPDHNASATVVKDSDLDALPDDPDDLSDMLAQLAGPTADGNTPSLMLDGFTGGTLPPKSTIKEIRLSQNPFSAEYDDLGFGRIEIITKPGTDSLHGSFQLTDSDSYFNSRNPYASNKADYVNRMFTETLSGSFKKKVSWTLNANEGKVDTDAIIHAITLTPSLSPLNVDQSVTTPNNRYSVNGKIDYQLNASNTLSARYAYYLTERQNLGIGGYSLISRAYGGQDSQHEVHLTETAILSPKTVTETRFSMNPQYTTRTGDNTIPSLIVSGSFNAGSAQAIQDQTIHTYNLRNVTTRAQGAHTLRFGGEFYRASVTDTAPTNFGGAFTFFGVAGAPQLDANNQPIPNTSIAISSLEQYRRTVLFTQLGYSPAAIQSLGGGASQFSISGGNPTARTALNGISVFLQDDWKVSPNLTISPGIRFEKQTAQHNSVPVLPRIGLAWSPDTRGGKTGKTVIRLGAGLFDDRFWIPGRSPERSR
jgi:outer membrane receptor for ferrienterochelin and colicin